MRGIPSIDQLATREDVNNIAMDLPSADAKVFLAKLGVQGARRVGINQEEYYILKSRVGYARWQEQARTDKELALRLSVENAKIEMIRAQRHHDDVMRRAQLAARDLNRTQAALNDAKGRLTEFRKETNHG